MATLELLLQRAQDPIVLVLSLISCAYALYLLLSRRRTTIPASLPWIGKDSSKFFAETRASYSGFSSVRQQLGEGYDKYTKQDTSYILPTFMSRPKVVVPKSNMSWLLEQPENVLSLGAAHYEFLEGEYAFTDKNLLLDPYHEHIIHKNLPRLVGALVEEMWGEIVMALDDSWGHDESSYQEICVFDNVMRIIGRVSNSMFIGKPGCRDDQYLQACQGFATQVVPIATIMQALPRITRPVVGPLLSLVGKYYWGNAAKHTIPIIREHLAKIEKKDKDPTFDWNEPNDYITWHIRTCQKEGRVEELAPERISRRLMILNFAAIHTTTITATSLLFDLFSSDPTLGFIEGIREEVTRVYMECNGVWSKAAVAKLIRTDSAIRESMRVSGFFTTGLVHKVVAKEGVRNEKQGFSLPYGSLVGMDLYSPMRDTTLYPNPELYDAFRSSRQRETYDALPAGEQDAKKELELRQLSMVTTGYAHTSFGHGKHACPGRFFVAQELKMMIAYTVMNYDVEMLKERPANLWFGQVTMPPTKAKLKIRRRARSVVG